MKTSICQSKGCTVPIASKRLHRHNRGRSPRTIQSRRTTVPIGTAHTHLMLYLSAQRYVSGQYPRTASADMPLQCLRHYDYTGAVSSTLSLPTAKGLEL